MKILEVDSYWSGPSGTQSPLSIISLLLFRQVEGAHCPLCRGKLLSLCPYSLLVVHPVLTVNCVSFCLCWILNVWLIQQLLDPQKDLFDGDGGPPVFVLLQDGQTHGAGWIDVRVEYWWLKFAFWW